MSMTYAPRFAATGVANEIPKMSTSSPDDHLPNSPSLPRAMPISLDPYLRVTEALLPASRSGPARRIADAMQASSRFGRFDAAIHRWLLDNSIVVLRVAVGIVYLGFGILKFIPDMSPAEPLTIKTMDTLTFGLVPGGVAMVIVGTLESIIGVMFITARGLRIAIYLLAAQFIGVFAPLLLFTSRLFSGPHHGPTLEGQYVIKDLILVAAGFVVASTLPGLVPGVDSERTRRGGPDRGGSDDPTDWTRH